MNLESVVTKSKVHSETSFSDLLIMARNNDPDALFELGNRHACGKCHPAGAREVSGPGAGAPRPFHATATVSTGASGFFDRSVNKNMRYALDLWSKAAIHGSSEAMYSLGLAYLEGDGVQQSHTQAIKWLLLAIACDHPRATATLHVIKDAVTADDREEGFRLMQEWLEYPEAPDFSL